MADHWKSIANLLGAPGVDEPEESQSPPTTADSDAANDDDQGSDDRQLAAESVQADPPVQPAELVADDSSDDHASKPAIEEAPDADELQLSWKKKPADQSPRSEHSSAGDVVASPVSRSKQEDAAEPKVDNSTKRSPKADPAPEAAAKPKRKGSWDTLARMFNIPGRAEEPAAVEESVAEDAAAPSSSNSELEVFSGAKDAEESNSALTELFPDAPKHEQPDSSWGKPKRVVDDIGWGDDEQLETGSSLDRDREETRGSSVEGSEVRGERDSEEAGDERRGRRRRRRGRGRGGRDRDSGSTEKPTDVRDSSDEKAEEDSDLSLGWKNSEGDTKESETRDRTGGRETIPIDDDGVALRRSGRRRRAGRNRDASADQPIEARARTHDGDVSDTPVGDSDGPSSRGRRRSSGSDRAERDRTDREPEAREEAPRRERPERDRPNNGERQRDAERGRDGRRRRRRPAEARNSGGDDHDLDQAAFDSELDGDDGHSVETKHRNIPTWQDSLEPIIEANIQNHKRNDHRGGQRGRSRGRRS